METWLQLTAYTKLPSYPMETSQTPYILLFSHNISVTDDGQRDGQTTTIMLIARPLLKYGRLKLKKKLFKKTKIRKITLCCDEVKCR